MLLIDIPSSKQNSAYTKLRAFQASTDPLSLSLIQSGKNKASGPRRQCVLWGMGGGRGWKDGGVLVQNTAERRARTCDCFVRACQFPAWIRHVSVEVQGTRVGVLPVEAPKVVSPATPTHHLLHSEKKESYPLSLEKTGNSGPKRESRTESIDYSKSYLRCNKL